MPGTVVKRWWWPELVGQPYITAYQNITSDRPDVHIEELGMDDYYPDGWPSDLSRVCVFINNVTMTVAAPAPQVG
jgi:hypothetical protein